MNHTLGRASWNRYLLIMMTLIILWALTACKGEEDQLTDITPALEELPDNTEIVVADTEWVIYWYLCGSDLESEYGAATNDLAELTEVQLPENVKVVIQTGGAMVWQNDIVNADTLGRYIFDHNGLQLIEELPSASMGDKETLKDFLLFAKNNYPSKHTAVVLWNHGGGSVSGASFDELYGMDSLSLQEMYQAFSESFGEDPQNQPVDIIGFDTCLMATVDRHILSLISANILWHPRR